jgi:Protein of unknown function (DUF3237)
MSETIAVEKLFTITADTSPPTVINAGPQGTRVIVNVTGGAFEGPKMKGTVLPGPGGDWLTMRADGTAKLDVRIILKTDDGADILMTYNGVMTTVDGAPRIRTAPLFETGDQRYAWLNGVQAVAQGAPGKGNVTYEVYALA